VTAGWADKRQPPQGGTQNFFLVRFCGSLSKIRVMNKQKHWEKIYETKEPTNVSWFQTHQRKSLELIESANLNKDAQIIDVGGGASTLIDDLLEKGYQNLTVLDISQNALDKTKARLGSKAGLVN
jgi:ubiquinone/menaquinone biosynthesis C-methylase UbiE